MPLSALDQRVFLRAASASRRPEIIAASSLKGMSSGRVHPKKASTIAARTSYNTATEAKRKADRSRKYASDRLDRIPATAGMTHSGVHEVRGCDFHKATYNFDAAVNSSSAGITLMNGIMMGDAFYQRDGNKIAMRNMHIRGYIHPRPDLPSGATDPYTSAPGKLRMIIVYDRQPTGALPELGDLLRSHNTNGLADTNDCSEINLNSRARFAVLRDREWIAPSFEYNVATKRITSGHQPGYMGEGEPWVINEFIKLKDLGTVYKGSANPMTIAHVSSGAIYMVLIKSGADVHMSAYVGWRIRYDDQ